MNELHRSAGEAPLKDHDMLLATLQIIQGVDFTSNVLLIIRKMSPIQLTLFTNENPRRRQTRLEARHVEAGSFVVSMWCVLLVARSI